jgi:hypothetical protein
MAGAEELDLRCLYCCCDRFFLNKDLCKLKGLGGERCDLCLLIIVFNFTHIAISSACAMSQEEKMPNIELNVGLTYYFIIF